MKEHKRALTPGNSAQSAGEHATDEIHVINWEDRRLWTVIHTTLSDVWHIRSEKNNQTEPQSTGTTPLSRLHSLT